MNSAAVSCKTVELKNHSKLYWQYNCKRIWLTLENVNGRKSVLNEVEVELFGYTYRLGYHLIKEYKNSLLFRSGCAANGGCTYILVNKSNGKIQKKFNQVICIDTDVKWEHPHPYEYNFVVYFSDEPDQLLIYFIDSKKTQRVPFAQELTSVFPTDHFKEMTLKGNVLTISMEVDNKKSKITINLNEKNEK